MKEIQDRADIFLLVSTFYIKIRKDTLLGPIFNSHITEAQWPNHLEKLTDFWTTNLLGISCFKGSPMQVHKTVDENLNYTIEPNHFGQWLQLWFATIDSLFEGELANKAKKSARRMSTGLFLSIYHNRPENKDE
ncbi:MAG: group III truncated hemoglobin [Flavobacteriaceae bacterium]|nr:group III truncated hemoglobin [Flavobacteriaceae bacterium]